MDPTAAHPNKRFTPILPSGSKRVTHFTDDTTLGIDFALDADGIRSMSAIMFQVTQGQVAWRLDTGNGMLLR